MGDKKMTKYNNKKTIVDGKIFDSKKEARRYQELALMEKSGKITNLELQPKFTLQEKFKYNGEIYHAITYTADFSYIEREDAKTVVEDVKGVETEIFKLKRKLFIKKFGQLVDFRIVR